MSRCLIPLVMLLVLANLNETNGGKSSSSNTGRGFPRSSSRGGSYRTHSGPSLSHGSTHTSNGKAKPGWDSGSKNTVSKPAGPPPAYPGRENRPISHPNAPPSYSTSNGNPPPYSQVLGGRSTFTSSGSSAYGKTFGGNGLGSNTHIYNNFYQVSQPGRIPRYLANAIFYGTSWHYGYFLGRHSSYRDSRSWSSEDDQQWRATTKAPYFENKVPGSKSYLPAAAILGAATAFGLASLLPLNVPENKPLMYCNSTDIAQTQIKLEGNIYSCVNENIAISCPRSYENSTVDECLSTNTIMKCDVIDTVEIVYCTNGTLLSRSAIMCNSTTILNENETIPILNCYPGVISEKLASFIPTITEAPVNKNIAKHLSIGAKMHIFFIKVVGKGYIFAKKTTTEDTSDKDPEWIPEALTFAPETTATTAEALTEPTDNDVSEVSTEDSFIYGFEIF